MQDAANIITIGRTIDQIQASNNIWMRCLKIPISLSENFIIILSVYWTLFNNDKDKHMTYNATNTTEKTKNEAEELT